ncbi:hypothetical protein FB561_1826 [Kribbella amoyensis]|uniref:Polyketide cyclase/dehydrase/lipid transport protein n=1 Tax=Kribbella amoyensis TaxID=996641 RepID=A0A561BPD9_9ACTN|nr:hypothetical protein [Kribbella amoyensis]TWD80738.1 hypothetical protein FB561_1826 [Kribbella amoyensis]
MLPWTWGTTAAEEAAEYACDRFVEGPSVAVYRAVDSAGSADAVYRWYCQLKVAPYSYDWIDNFGKRSPRTLTPGADELVLGQDFMTIFDLAAFEPGRDLTLKMKGLGARVFGRLAISYTVRPTDRGSRLVAKIALPVDPGPIGRTKQYLLAWGDLVMMRKQLLLFAELASSSARSDASRS